ncbi:MAG TPA: hypothetical protein PL124_03270 [Candidatus Cloacimonadota bacterium]|nr:hypothetical protein [Candidatus Cloacimonadota bacterium]HPS38414.1 hypothetical protein [Candidatus Cloacimonadota bacterium]
MKSIMTIALTLVMLVGVLFAEQTEPKNMTRPDDKGMTEMKMTPGDCPMGMGMGQGMMNMDEMKLTKEQKAKIENLRAAFQKQMNTLEAEVQNLKIDLMTAIDKDNFKSAKELNKALFAKKLQIADQKLDHMEAVLKELNGDQKDIARKMFKMHQMRNEGKGMGMGNGMGMHKMGMGMKQGGKGMDQGNCPDCQNKGMGNHKPGMQKMHDCR